MGGCLDVRSSGRLAAGMERSELLGVPLLDHAEPTELALDAVEEAMVVCVAGDELVAADTIMGDKALPYWLLKKIMLTCQSTDFAQISLAVNKIEGANPLLGEPTAAGDAS